MAFDRALTRAVLDAGMAVASARGDKAALAERLVPIVGETEAKGKTRTAVARVWLTPPAHAAAVIGWALDNHGGGGGDPSLLHFGALLATTPVVAPVAAAAARQVDKSGAVEPAKLMTALAKVVGTDKASTTAMANALDTLRALGILIGTAERPLGGRPTVPKELAGWFTHVLMTTRRATVMDTGEWHHAPELGLLGRRPTGGVVGYALLDFHGRGGRTLAVER